jgi:hypothetical protein
LIRRLRYQIGVGGNNGGRLNRCFTFPRGMILMRTTQMGELYFITRCLLGKWEW